MGDLQRDFAVQSSRTDSSHLFHWSFRAFGRSCAFRFQEVWRRFICQNPLLEGVLAYRASQNQNLIRRLVALKLWQARDSLVPERLMQKSEDGRDFDWNDL